MTDSEKFFCTDLAWEYGIPLIGTATRGDIWFLLEYTGRWGAKAFEESTLPQAVKDHLQAVHDPGVQVRPLLIKQNRAIRSNEFRFYVAQTHLPEPRLYEFHLQEYTDLLEIDLHPLVAGEPGDPAYQRKEPLYLVCTNGKRDQCCSIYGPEIYQTMRTEAGETVWQSSHIGGHNQAPIMLFFPYGINYAHTTPSEALRLMQAHQQGKLVLHHYRGRVCYDTHIQAAEHFWREQTGNLELPGVQIDAITELKPNLWQLTVCGQDGSDPIPMQIQRQFSDYEIPITCSKKKSAPVSSFHRINKQIEKR
jgi:hypothetical protein